MAPLALPLVLLILRRRNRTGQAWLIFVPLLVVALVWRTPLRLFGAPGDFEQMMGVTVVSLASGWAAVWLLGDWIGRQLWVPRQAITLGLMLTAASLGYVCRYEFAAGDEFAQMAILIGIGAPSLLMAMGLSARCCQREYRPGPFMFWLAFWVGLLSATLIVAITLPLAIAFSDFVDISEAMAIVGSAVMIGGLGFGTAIYLANLPFMVLAFRNPFYRQRFRDMFRLDRETWLLADPESRSPFARPKTTTPTDLPVSIDDVAGTWQFYLDERARTVAVEFHRDGTFHQTITTTSGETTECPAGTWQLEGPTIHLSGYTTADELSRVDRSWWMIDTPSGLAVFGGDGAEPDAHYRLIRQ